MLTAPFRQGSLDELKRSDNVFKKKKVEKKIPDDTYRVIKISKDALFEFIYESFIDNQETFFDVTDGTKIVTSFDVDWGNDSFIMVAQNADEELPFGKEIDVKKISKAIDDTTNTMYADNRYIDLTQEQLDAIQEKK